ncbi:MAG: DUF167 domain-containing protein [Thermoplasmatota archaeon]
MAHWGDAVEEVAGGVRLLVEVTPGARTEAFPDGFDEWREGRTRVRVRAAAVEGAANEAAIRIIAAFFGVAPHAVRLTAGARDRRKAFVIAGRGRAEVVAALGDALARVAS